MLWWVRPPLELRSTGADLDDSLDQGLAVAARWLDTGRSMAFDLWPRSEGAVNAGAAVYIKALVDGMPPDEALRQARLSLLRSGEWEMGDWAGWIHIGEPSAPVGVRKPNWFQRLFR